MEEPLEILSIVKFQILTVPYFPSCFCLQVEHLKAVLDGGAVCLALLQKQCLGGVIHKVVEHVTVAYIFIRYVRTSVNVGEGAEWCAVDDDGMLIYEVFAQIAVAEHAVGRCATHQRGLYAQFL